MRAFIFGRYDYAPGTSDDYKVVKIKKDENPQ